MLYVIFILDNILMEWKWGLNVFIFKGGDKINIDSYFNLVGVFIMCFYCFWKDNFEENFWFFKVRLC